MHNGLTLYRLVSTKRLHILKETYSWKLQICLSVCNLLLDTRHSRVKSYSESEGNQIKPKCALGKAFCPTLVTREPVTDRLNF